MHGPKEERVWHLLSTRQNVGLYFSFLIAGSWHT
uniref:Uncharacterized protein n=1 Tax=Anguilla anguilla TaxID=7936 RepID=A0A0E9R7J9_ANGAN